MEEEIENRERLQKKYDEFLEGGSSIPQFLEFQINEYLSVKMNNLFIQVYVNEKPFRQCKYLLIVDPLRHEQQQEIGSIDEVELLYSNDLESEIEPEQLGITKEQEFWAHCSNLQAWAESDYDSRLLHRNLAFPLLKELVEAGDAKAKKGFKDEIGVRFVSGYPPVMRYLFRQEYVDYLTPEEFSTLLDELDYSKLSLDLLFYEVDDYLSSRYGRDFLKRIAQEFKGEMRSSNLYVKLATLMLDKSELSPVAFTRDSKYFIRGSNDGRLKMFRCLSVEPELVNVFGNHTRAVNAIAVSREFKYVASTSEKDIKIWDFLSGRLLYILEGHEDDVNCMVFAPDSNYLASGSIKFEMSECAIKIWDVNEGKLKETLSSHWGEISCLAFSRDSRYLVSGAFDKTINLWDAYTGKLLNTFVGHRKPVLQVQITNDTKKIFSCSFGNIIKIWDIESGKELKEIRLGEASDWKKGFDLITFVLSPDNKFIIGGCQGSLEEGGLLKIWSTDKGEAVQTLPIKQDFRGYYEELNDIAISPNGNIIVAACRDRMVTVWVNFKTYLKYIEVDENYEGLRHQIVIKNF